MSVHIRPAHLPADYAAIAAVLAAENPGWSATAEELAYADATRDPACHHATIVALVETAGEPLLVGVAFVGHEPLAHRPDKIEINLRVRPNWQGKGVGKALYTTLLDHLAPFAPKELVAVVWHKAARAIRFLNDRGFIETWRRSDWVLAVPQFDFTPYLGLEERLYRQGIAVHTYSDLAVDPDRLAKLHELDWALWQAIPYGQAVNKRTLAQFAAQEIDHPKFIASVCFVAVKDGEFLGYSNLTKSDEGFSTEMTGVLPAWRNRGVATALKLAGIRYAQAH
ncbi:MAG: GNAT family N-acetyltransferase, partial [Caldilineaceae bacterium]|nr:GNAT family N-acetyltransferase [Caldilineaceae bacterium]